jgi:hypothetical protein
MKTLNFLFPLYMTKPNFSSNVAFISAERNFCCTIICTFEGQSQERECNRISNFLNFSLITYFRDQVFSSKGKKRMGQISGITLI